jgi:hypothetical protein
LPDLEIKLKMSNPGKTIYYALTPPDGGQVAIMQVVGDAKLEDCLAKFPSFTPIAVRQIAIADLPTHRKFRDAWRDDGASIVHDMEHAKRIHFDRMRAARAPLLAALDREYMRADEAGDTAKKARIASAKQALRDIPQAFDLSAAKTIDQLLTLWPSEIPKKE